MASCVSSRRDRFQITHARCFEVMQICEVMRQLFLSMRFSELKVNYSACLIKKKLNRFTLLKRIHYVAR